MEDELWLKKIKDKLEDYSERCRLPDGSGWRRNCRFRSSDNRTA